MMRPNWPPLLLLACSLLAAAAAAAPSTPPPGTWVGRFWPGPLADGSMPLPQLMTWAASSASFAFSGSSVTVVIDGSLASLPAAHQTRAAVAGQAAAVAIPWCTFQFVLDGQASVAVTRPAAPVLTWTRQLAPGKHTLTITKVTQAASGAAWLRSVMVGGGSFLPPPQSPGQASGRRMLFMGDSYTAGSGNAGNRSCSSLAFENEDALRTYALATARHFNADAQLLAWAGAGLNVPVRRHAGGRLLSAAEREIVSPLMAELFTRADALTAATQANLQSFIPQIVVLAAGTNDFRGIRIGIDSHHLEGELLAEVAPIDAWLDKWEAYVRQIRAAYPAAAIITLVWPFEQQLAGVQGPYKTPAYLQYMAAAHTRLQMAGIQNTHLLQIVGESFNSIQNWCFSHPDAAAHAKVAQQLIQYIAAVFPSWAAAAA